MTHTKEFLILELHRFYKENHKVPVAQDMQARFGYPSLNSYQRHFGSWNNARIEAGFEKNKKTSVKVSVLSNGYNKWSFRFNAKKEAKAAGIDTSKW